MPVRRIPINTRVPTGYFYSEKNARVIECESPIERDVYLLFEFEDNVKEYKEQPFVVKKRINNKDRIYYPDCLVVYKPGSGSCPLLVEIKSKEDIDDKKKTEALELKFQALREYAEENSMDFKVILDTDIRGQRLDNLKFLYRYREEPKALVVHRNVILKLLSKNTMSVSVLLDTLAQEKNEKALIIPCIWHLLYKKFLETDLDKQLTNNSEVRIKQ